MSKNELRKSLSLYGLVMIAVGSTIGSGIFRTPGAIAAAVHLPELVVLVWVMGGVVALSGALVFAEMGSMFPNAGGLYVYLRKAYGDAAGFLYGWFTLFISTPGAIAALAMVCSEHLLVLCGYGSASIWEVPLALGIIVFLTVVNLFGVNIGEWIANLFTGAKLIGLLLIMAAAVWWAPSGGPMQAPAAAPDNLWGALAIAFVGVLWSYGGWHHASFMAGETANPQKNIPRAMMIGAGIVTLVYVLVNLAYMRLLPLEQIANSKTVAADAMGSVTSWGARLMAFLIALSTFGTTGIYCMTAPRIYYAMANDGIFFRQLAETHPRWKTPVRAMLVQSAWSVFLLLFWGTFENLMTYVTFMDWAAMMMVGTTIYVFRKRMPDAPRAYRTWGYPLTPAVFVAICLWFVLFTVWEDPVRAGAGMAVGLAGYLFYVFVFRKKAI
ncbi:MAG: amino acid permease [Bacteroidetes bacterium]|nr:amino acid permease [Bacteroidota bacterium]